MGGEKKLARRRERGVLNAWERLNYLVDDGSFVETGLLGASGMFADDVAKTPRDGKIAGFARIDGRDVAVCVNDFTVKGASTSATNSKKMGHIRRVATEKGFPFVHIGESTGARLPDAMGARGMGLLLGNRPATQFRRTRESPWAAAALDASFGSSAWLCCVSDFAVMKKGSTMCVSSSRLVSMAIGEQVDLEALGGWRLHAESTGLIDRFVDADEEAMDEIRRFLSYLPSHNMEAPPVVPVATDAAQDQRPILDVLPERRTQIYDMRKIIRILVDRDSYFELKPRFGRPAVTALARFNGRSVGLIANNPLVGGGALSAEACRKIIDFQVLCDSFNIPLVRLMDTPGFVVGTDAERKGAPGWIMNFMNSTLPGDGAEHHRAGAQGLRPRLRRDGGRAAQRRDDRVAERRGELHGPGVRDHHRARQGPRRRGLRGGAGPHPQGHRGVGHGDHLLGAEHHQAAGDARLPHPHARRVPQPARWRGREAPHAELADELLMASPRKRKFIGLVEAAGWRGDTPRLEPAVGASRTR